MTNLFVILPLILFMAAMLLIGVYLRRREAEGGFLASYFVGGKTLGAFTMAMTTVATYSSVSSFVGGPGMAHDIGFGWVYMAVIQACTVFLVLGIFGKRVALLSNKLGAVTVVDILRARFGSDILAGVAAIVIVIFFTVSMVAQFVGGAKLFASVTGYPYEWGIVIFAVVVILYTTIGGFRGVAVTDTCCAIAMLLGIVLFVYYLLEAGGGFTSIMGTIARDNPHMLTPTAGGAMPVSLYISQWLLIGGLTMALPQSVVRSMSYRSSRDMRKALLIGTLVIGLMNMGINVAGILSRSVLPESAGAYGGVDSIIPEAMVRALPDLALGLAIIGPIAASISTISSVLLVASSAIVKDVYLAHQRERADVIPESRLRMLSMGTTFVLGAAAFIISLSPPNLIWIINMFAFGGLETAFFWVLVLGLYTKCANKTGAICSMVGGTIVYCLAMALKIKFFDLHQISIGIVASLVFFAIGNYFGKRTDESTLKIFFG